MISPGDASTRRSGWLWCLVPVASAMVFHLSTLRAGYVFDDAELAKPGSSIESLDPRRIFLESYLSPDRIDPGYRPLTYITFAIERRLGAGARTQHAVNVALHAAAALLAFLLLRELLGGGAAARMAATGAAIFAALPIVTDAVARISGRADILAGIATLGAWLIAIRNAPSADKPREGTPGILAAGAITFAGLFARENTAVAVPLLIAATSWLTRRRFPWRTAVACACAVLGWLAIEGVILEGRPFLLNHTGNPLIGETFLTRSMNGIHLLALYALKIVSPFRLSAEYTIFDLEPRPWTDPSLWLGGVGIIAAIIGVVSFFRRRAPIVALAALVLFITLLPVANVLLLADSFFQERSAYTASLAWPVAICLILQAPVLLRSKPLATVLGFTIIIAYGTRTLVRNEDWVRADPLELTSVSDSPQEAQAMFFAYGRHYEKALSVNARKELRDRALAKAERELKLHPSDGWAEALQGHVFSLDKKSAETIDHLTKAERLLAGLYPPVTDPLLHQLRGDAYFALGKIKEASQDFDRHIRLLESQGKHPEATTYNRRGLTLAQQGDLQSALADFDKAISDRDDLPEIWNNRGFCRFKLGHFNKAIEDYQKGLVTCEKQGINYAASGDSVHAFLLRLADVYLAMAQQHLAAKDEESAKQATANAAKLKAEAERIAALHAPPAQKEKAAPSAK